MARPSRQRSSRSYSQFHGTCFRCGGTGRDITNDKVLAFPKTWTDEQIEAELAKREDKRRTAAAKRTAKADAEKAAVWAANLELYPFLAEAIDLEGIWHVAYDICWGARFGKRTVSEKQAALVEKAIGQAKERAAELAQREADKASKIAAGVKAPTGRTTVEGTILSMKWYDSDFGSTCKILVDCGDYKVFGSRGSKISDAEVGDRVRFSADFTPGDEDPLFARFVRPTKGEIL